MVDLDALEAQASASSCESDPLAFADALLSVPGLFALQLRAKRCADRRSIQLARSLAARCRRAQTPFVVNDRPDIALLADADAVHVGQEDLSIRDVRRAAPGLLVGVSTHDLAQLDEALAEGPDYVAFGPVFDTRSKRSPDPTVGLAQLANAAERCRAAGVSLVAIGGITADNAAAVRAAGAASGAVIAALVSRASDAEALVAAASALHRALSP